MNVFLDYRERYYGTKAQDDKIALVQFLDANNGTAIKRKLSDYKNWWNGNRTKVNQSAIKTMQLEMLNKCRFVSLLPC